MLFWLAINAFCSVPVFYVVFDTVSKVSAARDLTLTKIFNGTQSILLNTLGVLDNLLYDNGLRERFIVALGMDCLGSTVKETLFTEAKSVCFRLSSNIAVNFPIIVTLALFSRSVVGMSLDVHLLMFRAFFKTTSVRVENSLSVGTVFGRASK